MSAQSTKKVTGRKPTKPSKDFPLTKHKSGKWCKKVRGKIWYFGRIDDPQSALDEWLHVKDDLLAGRKPRPKNGDGLTVAGLCNLFLTAKQLLRDSNELSPRTWQEYYAACELVVDTFGKGRLVGDLRSEDFQQLRAKMTKKWGPVRVGNVVQYVRLIFIYAYNEELVPVPIRFGSAFKRPSKKTLRKARHEKGPRLFSSAELRTVIDLADNQLKAMILLGINCGLGNTDCSQLDLRHLDLSSGWLNYPRPKTGIDRRCALWPETVESIRNAISTRPKAKQETELHAVFLTSQGQRWVKTSNTGTPADALSQEFTKLLKTKHMHRPGVGFYALRHVFETVGGGCKDQVAVNAIMGHVDSSMAAHYREHIEDNRLKAVTDHVHRWLFDSAPAE